MGRDAEPTEDFLIIHNFSGISTQCNGMQTLLFNEFDKGSGFYRVLPAEDLVRQIANEYTNSYQIGIFTNSTKS